MVPSGWENKVLKDVFTVSSGGTPSRANESYWNGNIPWVTTSEVKNGIITNTQEKITDQGLENSSAKLFPKNTILMAMYGQGKTRGQVAILGIQAATNQACAALIINNNYDVNFYFHYLISQYENIRELANSGGQKNLSANIIKSMVIPVPPLPEQQKIAQILSSWDKVISTTEALISNSKAQKKALMQQLLTGKKRLINPETGKVFEGEWEEVKLGSLGETFNGLTGKTKEHFGKGKKFIPYINIFRNSSVDINALELVDVSENEKQNAIKYGDIFFTTSSETPHEVGMSSVFLHKPQENIYLNSFCFGFRPFDLNKTKPEFMVYLLRSANVRRSISLLAQGATRYNLSKIQLLKISINLPNLIEQQKIASVLSAADKEIELLEAKLSYLKQEKKALMQQLLTGKRRVKV